MKGFTVANANVDLSGDQVTFLYSAIKEGITFPAASFNGYEFQTAASDPAMTGVSLVSTNIPGLTASDFPLFNLDRPKLRHGDVEGLHEGAVNELEAAGITQDPVTHLKRMPLANCSSRLSMATAAALLGYQAIPYARPVAGLMASVMWQGQSRVVAFTGLVNHGSHIITGSIASQLDGPVKFDWLAQGSLPKGATGSKDCATGMFCNHESVTTL